MRSNSAGEPPFARSVEELSARLQELGIQRTHEAMIAEGDGSSGYVYYDDANGIPRRVNFDTLSVTAQQACATVVALTGLPFGGIAQNEFGHTTTYYRP